MVCRIIAPPTATLRHSSREKKKEKAVGWIVKLLEETEGSR